MQLQFPWFSGFIDNILDEICATTHWMRMKDSVMISHEPLFSHEPLYVITFEMFCYLVHCRMKSCKVITPYSDSFVAIIEEAKQYEKKPVKV